MTTTIKQIATRTVLVISILVAAGGLYATRSSHVTPAPTQDTHFVCMGDAGTCP